MIKASEDKFDALCCPLLTPRLSRRQRFQDAAAVQDGSWVHGGERLLRQDADRHGAFPHAGRRPTLRPPCTSLTCFLCAPQLDMPKEHLYANLETIVIDVCSHRPANMGMLTETDVPLLHKKPQMKGGSFNEEMCSVIPTSAPGLHHLSLIC